MSSTGSQSQSSDVDPVERFKTLVPRLKEALSNLMKTAAYVLSQNAQVDIYLKTGESSIQKLERSLEEFYAVCDQLEVSIKLALECKKLQQDTNKNTPLPVLTAKPDSNTPSGHEGLTYTQYLNTVNMQISSAKEIHDLLLDCASKVVGQQVV